MTPDDEKIATDLYKKFYNFVRANGFQPSRHEISMWHGYRTVTFANNRMYDIQELGFIKIDTGRTRDCVILLRPDGTPFHGFAEPPTGPRLPDPEFDEEAFYANSTGRGHPRHMRVFEFIYNHMIHSGSQPSIRELMALLGFGSAPPLRLRIEALGILGYVKRSHGDQYRSMKVLRRPDGSEFTGFVDK